MTQQEFEAPQPGDPIARDGESLIYLVTSVKCRYTEVIVHTVRVIHTKAFEQWERVEDNAGISFLPTDSDKLPDFNLLPIALDEQGNPKVVGILFGGADVIVRENWREKRKQPIIGSITLSINPLIEYARKIQF